ncbi:hypothetical protein MNBD_ALPHA06-1425 [hydrothermal vent metagenome]|uniref:Uncharacterized protein n=1 Tax=hydrothermal vent metagenome TaxID=652676 RepID=A0A3B0S4K3_9ZZZZ
MNNPQKTSVQQLSELYNVVIGVALSLAMYNTLDAQATSLLPVSFEHLPQLGIFLVLIIPFYHGAVRHLFATYIEDASTSNIKNGALLADFVLFFIEGCFFVMMAGIIGNIYTLTWVVAALLLLDSVWGIIATIVFSGKKSLSAVTKWVIINLCCVAVLIFLLLPYKENFAANPFGMSLIVLMVLLIRTVVDYTTSWGFYFPKSKAEHTPVIVEVINPDGGVIDLPEGTKITISKTETFVVAKKSE